MFGMFGKGNGFRIIDKINRNILLAVMSVFTAAVFLLSYDMVSDEFISQVADQSGRAMQMLFRLAYAMEDTGTGGMILVFFCFILYRYSMSLGRLKTEEKVLGVLLAFTFLFGRAFDEFGTTAILVTGLAQAIKTALILAGYLLFFPHCVKAVRNYAAAHFTFQNGIDFENPARYRRIVFVVMLVVWSVHLAAYFPGMFMGDTEDIIYMAYNYHTGLADSVNLLSEDVLVVDHHSVLYTVILGFFVKLGRFLFHSENAGIFIYTIVQMAFTAWVLAYSLYKLKQYRVRAGLRTVILLFFCFFPWIPRYAIMATKDTLFADFMMLYLLNMMDIVAREREKIKMGGLAAAVVYAVLIFLLRKNGLYMVVLSLPFLLMVNRNWLKTIAVALVCIFAAKLVYSDIILPAAKIPDGSVSAALSVPLQQTARYLVHYPDEVTSEEYEAINGVVDFEALAETYWPDRSDWAKAAWRKEATGTDMMNYFAAWAKMFVKHPLTYVAATANNCYGYFYPVVMDLYDFERSSVGGMASANAEGYFDFHHSGSRLSMACRRFLKLGDALLMKLPLLNIIDTSAVYIWLLVFSWTQAIIKKDRKLLMLVVPVLMLMLTILTGPCNGNVYHRFTYPVAMCVPVVAAYGMRKRELPEQELAQQDGEVESSGRRTPN